MNLLSQLKQHTTVVADTGDFQLLAQFQPQDATTNPSLVLKTVQNPNYQPLFKDTLSQHAGKAIDEVMDYLLVRLGLEILSIVPGRVSTEVDARLSTDTAGTLARARRIIAIYRAAGVDTEKQVLIKIASTWEGIQAAKILEQEGVHTNLTLLFSKAQAVACADAGVQLISPFVGRIYDWYKREAGSAWDEAANAGANDPGVKSVRDIFHYYKHFGIKTEIMGASFRNLGQIAALAGCDLLTISPDLLAMLQNTEAPLARALDATQAGSLNLSRINMDEAAFRSALENEPMAHEKLFEGIAAFSKDTVTLEALMQAG